MSHDLIKQIKEAKIRKEFDFGWLIDWLTGRLSEGVEYGAGPGDPSAPHGQGGHLPQVPADQLIHSSMNWSVDLIVDWSVNCMVCRLID